MFPRLARKGAKCCMTAMCLAASSMALAETVRYEHGNWFIDDRFVKQSMLVTDGVFAPDRAGPVDRTVDLSGQYVILALGEAHNHNLQNCRMAPGIAKAYVKQGILYSAQLFATDPRLEQCAALFKQADVPSVAFASIGVTSSTGHPIGIARASVKQAGIDIPDSELTAGMLIADSAKQVAEHWPAAAARRTDFVKVILIDAENHARNIARTELNGYNGVSPEVLAAVVRAAHQDGLRVVAHVDTAADFALAVKEGVDTIAHLPGYRIAEGYTIGHYRLQEAAVREAAARKVTVIPTVAASHQGAQAEVLAANYRLNLQLLQRHRVQLLTGSDSFAGSVIDELTALQKTGLFTPAQLIKMSSVDTPGWMFPKRKVACMDQGCEASFVAYDGNPLAKLETLKAPALVVRQGKPIASSKGQPH